MPSLKTKRYVAVRSYGVPSTWLVYDKLEQRHIGRCPIDQIQDDNFFGVDGFLTREDAEEAAKDFEKSAWK